MNKQHWKYKKLGEVSSFSRGLTYSKSDVVVESSNKVLRSNNIDLSTHSLNFDDVVCLNDEFEIPFDKMLQPNDIFICMSNGSTQHLGKVAFIEKKIDYAFGGFMGAIHPNLNEIYPKYAYYYCLSSEYRRSLASVLNGININNIKWSDLSKFPIAIPPLVEQERIVAELDLLSGIIEKNKEQLKAYDQLAQSIFYTMFGDPIDNPKGWEVKKLGEISTIGTGATPSREKEELYYGGDIHWVKTTEVHNCDITETEETITQLAIEQTNCKIYPPNTLLMAMYGQGKTRGQIAKLRINAATNQACAAIMLDFSICNLDYVYELLLINYECIRAMAQGGNQANLNMKLVASIPIIFPPLSLQQEFAEKVEAIERQKGLVRRSIEETQTMFDYTMDKYFG